MNPMKRSKKRAVAVPSPVHRPWALTHLAMSAGLVLLTLLAFSNSFATGFALDSQTLLLEDTRIQTVSVSNLSDIVHHTYWWPHGESGLYRPLTTLSYLFNYSILGDRNHAAGYHWINCGLHTANVLLLFALMLRLLGKRPRALTTAFIIAMLWAVHPVLTESVTNIVGRADLLAGFGVLGGFLLYLVSMDTMGWHRTLTLIGLGLAAAVGAFSKESAVLLPAIVFLYELVCARRWRKMAAGCIVTLVPIGLMLWQRAVVLSSSLPAEYPFTDNPITGAGFWIGHLTAVKVLVRYLFLAVWPMKLSADYSYSQISLFSGSAEDWICLITAACAVALTIILWSRSRLAFFFAGFALINILPASNLLFPIGAIMAERFLYLPLAGLVAAFVIAIDRDLGGLRYSAIAFVMCGALIAGVFTMRTWLRNLDWTDDQTMALSGVATSPRSFKFHRLLAATLMEADPSHRDVDRAVKEAERSTAILGRLPDELDLPGPWNLAAVCTRVKGDTLKGAAARAQYEESARLALRSIAIDAASRAAYDRRHGIKTPVPASAAEGYRTLASAYLHLERAQPALAAATQAQSIDPSNVGVYEEIADADLAGDRVEDAAIALAQGMISTGDRSLGGELLALYQKSGIDSKGCAALAGPHGPTLNPSCEIVRRDFCQATLRARRPDLHLRFGCPE